MFERIFARPKQQDPDLDNAERGVRWLDNRHPDWATKIPDGLDVRCGNNCVVFHLTGKLYGRPSLAELGIHNPISLGFFVKGSWDAPEVLERYAKITTHFRTARDNRLRVVQKQIEAPRAELKEELVEV